MVLVAIVPAVIFVIAPCDLLDAAMCRIATKLIQPAGRFRSGASFLVFAVTAVQVTVASLLFRQTMLVRRTAASEVVPETFPVT